MHDIHAGSHASRHSEKVETDAPLPSKEGAPLPAGSTAPDTVLSKLVMVNASDC